MSQSKSMSQLLAEASAASHMFALENDLANLGYSYVYDQVLNDPESAWQSNEFNVHNDYADHEGEGLIESMSGLAQNVENSLTHYAELIKSGASIHALYGNLGSDDVAQWDMDAFAQLGHAVKHGITIGESSYNFDIMKCEWVNNEIGAIDRLEAHWADNFFPDGYGSEKSSPSPC
jgi:hypothetical protein